MIVPVMQETSLRSDDDGQEVKKKRGIELLILSQLVSGQKRNKKKLPSLCCLCAERWLT